MHLSLLGQVKAGAGWGGDGEGQGVRCHCQDRPWTLAHKEQAQEALADLPYRCRQTKTQTAHSDSLASGNFGNENSYIFHTKRNRFWHLRSRNRN